MLKTSTVRVQIFLSKPWFFNKHVICQTPASLDRMLNTPNFNNWEKNPIKTLLVI